MKQLSLLSFLSLIAMPVFAAQSVDLNGLVQTVITLVIVALIFWVIMWFVGYVGVPEPFNKVAIVIIALVAVIILLDVVLGVGGVPHGLIR